MSYKLMANGISMESKIITAYKVPPKLETYRHLNALKFANKLKLDINRAII